MLLLVSPHACASLLASTHRGARRPLIYLRGGEVVAADLKKNAGASARYRAYDLNKDGVLNENELRLAVATAVQRVDQKEATERPHHHPVHAQSGLALAAVAGHCIRVGLEANAILDGGCGSD